MRSFRLRDLSIVPSAVSVRPCPQSSPCGRCVSGVRPDVTWPEIRGASFSLRGVVARLGPRPDRPSASSLSRANPTTDACRELAQRSEDQCIAQECRDEAPACARRAIPTCTNDHSCRYIPIPECRTGQRGSTGDQAKAECDPVNACMAPSCQINGSLVTGYVGVGSMSVSESAL